MKYLDKDHKTFYEDHILYLDNHLVVVDKPYNILTQKNDNGVSVEEELKKFLKFYLNKKNVFLHPVHRIDKVASGLVLFARSSKALSRLNKEMREKNIERRYRVIVEGIFEIKKGVLENYLIKKEFYSKVSKEGKKAILKYEVLKEYKKYSLLEIILITGRYHQIRAQFSHINHPILGDVKYKSREMKNHVFLNSYFLGFIHPVTKEKIKIFSKISFDKL